MHYAKTTCLISFKLRAFNNDILSFQNVNFLRDWLSFKVNINFTNLMKQWHSCVLWSCKYKNQLDFFQNIKFKGSNDWLLVVKLRIRHHPCAYVYTPLFSRLAPPYMGMAYLYVTNNNFCIIISCVIVYIFGMSLIGQCLFKNWDCINIEITYLMVLFTLENSWQVFKFHLALYEWGQIALSLDFSHRLQC